MDPFGNPNVYDLRRNRHDMRRAHHYLDSCMFERDDGDQDKNRILELLWSNAASFPMHKQAKDEVDDPATPLSARSKADALIVQTFAVNSSLSDQRKKLLVDAIMINPENPEKYRLDANHVLEAGIHNGFFITSDKYILKRKKALLNACGAIVVNPPEWLALWDSQ